MTRSGVTGNDKDPKSGMGRALAPFPASSSSPAEEQRQETMSSTKNGKQPKTSGVVESPSGPTTKESIPEEVAGVLLVADDHSQRHQSKLGKSQDTTTTTTTTTNGNSAHDHPTTSGSPTPLAVPTEDRSISCAVSIATSGGGGGGGGGGSTVAGGATIATNTDQSNPGAYAIGGPGFPPTTSTEEGDDDDLSLTDLSTTGEHDNNNNNNNNNNINSNARGENDEPSPSAPSATTAATHLLLQSQSVTGLSIANLVLEEEDQVVDVENLPRAQDVNEGTSSTIQKRKAERRSKTCLLLGILLLTVCVTLIITLPVVMLMPARQDTEPNQLLPKPTATTTSTTGAPTSSPTTLEANLLSLLVDITPVETLQLLEDNPDLPQAKAYEWVLDDISRNPTTLSEDRILQRYILSTLYFATNGEEWVSKENWLDHDIHECDWFTSDDFSLRGFFSMLYPGFLGDMFPEGLPKPCNNDSGLLEHLWLDQNNLVGEIPLEVFQLTTLQSLSFALNQLEGTLSSQIGKLTSLVGLSIMGLQQGGTIPSEIGLLTNTHALVLTSNNHVGSIPQRELQNLSNLEYMIVGQNKNLGGQLPDDLTSFSNLKWIVLDDCDLTGTIPTTIGHLSSMNYIIFGRNRLSGQVPSEIGLLSNLYLLSLAENQLSGSLPSQLGSITQTQVMELHRNRFSGTIPSQVGLLSNLSSFLSLGDNPLLGGWIPSDLGRLTNLYDLSLANNNHNGPLPSQLGLLSSIGSLVLRNNSFSGTMPEELVSLDSSLYVLDIRANSLLSGTVPDPLCNLTTPCVQSSVVRCGFYSQHTEGLVFDCNNDTMLCGCDCSCS